MIRFFIFSLTCLIFNITFGQNESQKQLIKSNVLQNTSLNFDTSKITLLNLETDWWLRKKLSSTKSFNLTNYDIKAIDEVFKICANENNIDTSYFHYKRQYVPFLNKTGQKKVWINCFCSDLNDEFTYWKKSIVIVDDGGSCFFNLLIDLNSKAYSNFEENSGGY
jgi:hypothetical protein